ncbi:uncharacterized protein V1513DRAFT_371955 [Lipomyces chichibuensis]|uniref:uncharacterized protein n=1 Tax=Lipomyces chichibuensis TaxID=1546026 RepID=UPI00334339F4
MQNGLSFVAKLPTAKFATNSPTISRQLSNVRNNARCASNPVLPASSVSILQLYSGQSVSQVSRPFSMPRRHISYYGSSRDDEFINWRSVSLPATGAGESSTKTKGAWLILPQLAACALLVGYIYALDLFVWPGEPRTYKDMLLAYLNPEVGDNPSPWVIYNTARDALFQIAGQRTGGGRGSKPIENGIVITLDWPLLLIVGLCFGVFIGKRYGPRYLRQFLVRYGYVRPDVYVLSNGKRRYDAPYISLLLHGFSHRNWRHLLFMTALFGTLAINVAKLTTPWNVLTLFGAGTIFSGLVSMTLGPLFTGVPIATSGLGGAVAALVGFLVAFSYNKDVFKSIHAEILRLLSPRSRQEQQREVIPVIEGPSREQKAHMIKNIAAKMQDAALENEDVLLKDGKITIALVNKSPIVKDGNEEYSPLSEMLPQHRTSPDLPPEKLFFQITATPPIKPPILDLSTLIMIIGGVSFAMISLAGAASRRVPNGKSFALDFPGFLGGLLWGGIGGNETRQKVENANILVIAMPRTIAMDHMVMNPKLTPHLVSKYTNKSSVK